MLKSICEQYRGGDRTNDGLSTEERHIVELVREWVDKEVRPVVRELEHANTPEDLIEQMKEMGIYGLAIPSPTAKRRSPCPATSKSPPSWPVAG